MIRQAMDTDLRPDPCRRCKENYRTDRRERTVSLAAALTFWLCGLAVVLLEGTLALAVTVGLASGAVAVALTLTIQQKLEHHRLQTCGGCR